jgi:two-component system OmpR family sensor kinase
VSGIGSWLRRYWLETAWGLFSVANVVVILSLSAWETIPFHFIWVSLTLVYGFRVWPVRMTGVVLGVVMVITAIALVVSIQQSRQSPDELAEVPLMAAMFVAMVWHARRHHAATEEVRRLAENEHRLRERERDFARKASHELRTPITVARGHAELIRASAGSEELARDAEVVLDELGRLARISERLLILAAADSPGFLHKRPVDLGELIEGRANRWTATVCREWRLTLSADAMLLADQERLETALDALIENAVKFTHEGDPITIETSSDGHHALVSVADGGEGIPSDQLESIFEGFARVEPSILSKPRGTGLGLAIVKAIVEAHGGSVEVHSALGRGATFVLRLPWLTRAAVVPLPETGSAPSRSASGASTGA